MNDDIHHHCITPLVRFRLKRLLTLSQVFLAQIYMLIIPVDNIAPPQMKDIIKL